MVRYFVVDAASIWENQFLVIIDNLAIFVGIAKMIEKTFAIGPVRHRMLPALNVEDATGSEEPAVR